MNQPAAHTEQLSAATIRDELRQAAYADVDAALGQLSKSSDSPVEAVHACRKAIKRLRALVRLGSCVGKDWQKLDRQLRDTGRMLGPARDATVIRQTLQSLLADSALLETIEDEIPAGYRMLESAELADKAGARLNAIKDALPGFFANEHRWAWPAVVAAAALGYERAAQHMREFLVHDSDETAHEWRKAVKQHASQLALLVTKKGGKWSTHTALLETLSTRLGEHHDCSIVRARLRRGAGGARKKTVKAARKAAAAHQADLRRHALRTGGKAFSRTAENFAGALVRARASHVIRAVAMHGD